MNTKGKELHMAQITITTKNCTVVDVIDLSEFDISKPLSKAVLVMEIMSAIEIAEAMEIREE